MNLKIKAALILLIPVYCLNNCLFTESTPVNKKSFTDDRDGHVYTWVEIGNQSWMAQNLNYYDDNFSSYCYDNDPGNCDIYGRLYYWYDALDLDTSYINKLAPTGTVKGICPTGWHVPSKYEWEELALFIDPISLSDTLGGRVWDDVGKKLKSAKYWSPLTGRYRQLWF